ncbi:MAG: hypothetical protein HRU43_06760, partial [Simkaniaceae bacterium]|nr:hypothetical protein [Simkaniaceae bacterium]
MVHYLQTKAENEAKKQGIVFRQTETARYFTEVLCPGVDLKTLGEDVSQGVIDQLRASDAVTLAYVRAYIVPDIKYYPTILESTGQDLINMFAKVRTHTGTPEEELLPIGSEVVERSGILGQSLHTLEKKAKERRVFEKSDPEDVLQTDIIDNFFKASSSNMMVIDRGATLNGLLPEEVSRKVWGGIQGIRTEIKGVVFYAKDRAMILTAAGVRPLSESKIQPHEYLTYFDEPHTYAANVKQKVSGEVNALLTIGETTTFEKETDQAAYRDRKVELEGHNIIIGMTKNTQRKVLAEDRAPTPREVTLFLHKNGRLARKKRQFFIQTQKLKGLAKRAVLDKALAASAPAETVAILKKFEEMLLTKVPDDPTELFGSLLVRESRLTVLHKLRINLLEKLESKRVFRMDELENLNIELVKVIEGTRFTAAEKMFKDVKQHALRKQDSLEGEPRRRFDADFGRFLTNDIQLAVTQFFKGNPAKDGNPMIEFKRQLLEVLEGEFFSHEEIEEIDGMLTEFIGSLPPIIAEHMVDAYKKESGELSVEELQAQGRTVRVEASADVENEEQDQEQDLQNVNNLALAGQNEDRIIAPDTDIEWSAFLTPRNPTQWFKLIDPTTYKFPYFSSFRGYTPPLFRLRDGLKLAKDEATREFGKTLPPSICCSWNMFKVFSSSGPDRAIEPFGKRQKPILEFLVVQKNEKQKIILIDQKEAEYWGLKLLRD